MSLEISITELAAAIRMLAEGIAGAARSNAHGQIAAALGEAAGAVAEVTKNTGAQTDSELRAAGKPGAKDQDLEQAVRKVEADAKKAESEQAEINAAKVREAEAKKNAGAADTQTSTGGDTAGSVKEAAGDDQVALDYEKDVKPVLIKLAGAKGKPEMTALVQSFGVAKATELKGEQLTEIVAKANALMEA